MAPSTGQAIHASLVPVSAASGLKGEGAPSIDQLMDLLKRLQAPHLPACLTLQSIFPQCLDVCWFKLEAAVSIGSCTERRI
eukprot:6188813-Pleurochrysis_carterae.AAC.1